MGKWAADEVLDSALLTISRATRMLALGDQPTDYAAAWSGRLAEAPMASGDFAIAPGSASGRRVQVAAKTGVPVTTAGTANHVALVDMAASQLLYVTTCPGQALVVGGSVNFDGWSVEIGAPL